MLDFPFIEINMLYPFAHIYYQVVPDFTIEHLNSMRAGYMKKIPINPAVLKGNLAFNESFF